MSSTDATAGRPGSRTTLGPQLLLKKNRFQGLVIPVTDAATSAELDVDAVVKQALAEQPRLRTFQAFPRASRVRAVLANSSLGAGLDLLEACEDDALCGVGDRLLHLLQRWQVLGVVLVVAHRDGSLSGRLLGGAELFKLVTEAAKLALEQHYVDAVAHAAKITAETQAAERLAVSTAELGAKTRREELQQVIPAACVMSSATVASWPQHHEPTSDGGGRKQAKRGRVNHFRYREMAVAEREQQREAQVSPGASEGGLEWLGISREEWRKLRSIRVPVKELHYLFMCLVVLIEPPTEQRGDGRRAKPTPKHQEHFTPSDFSWPRCRDVLHRSAQWSHQLRGLRGASMAASQAAALRAVFQEPTFTESAFVRIAGGAGAKIFSWLQRLLDEADEKNLGLLRIDAPSDAAGSPGPPVSPEGSAREEGELQEPQEQEQEQDHAQEREQEPKAPASPELRAMQSVDKDPTSPTRTKRKIVDPGRLFTTPNAAHPLQFVAK